MPALLVLSNELFILHPICEFLPRLQGGVMIARRGARREVKQIFPFSAAIGPVALGFFQEIFSQARTASL